METKSRAPSGPNRLRDAEEVANELACSLDDVRLLSKQDLADLFKISSRQVSNLMKQEGFPKKVGGLGSSIRFCLRDVKEFVNNG